MKYNKREIMKRAWELKDANVKKFGFVRTEYNRTNFRTFGECLKEAWDEAKYEMKLDEIREANRKRREAEAEKAASNSGSEIAYTIPNWLAYEKDIMGIRPTNVRKSDVERETAKAFRAYGIWFPKSQCKAV